MVLIGLATFHRTTGIVASAGEQRSSFRAGGRAFFPAVATELASVYGEICAELANQYFLAYESTKPGRDGQFHRISVRVDRSGAVARARPGYFAPTQYLTNEPFYGSRLWAHFL